jgi:tetratricopeptide (TPR) repeat protein
LANHYLNNDRRHEALSHYLKARKKEPDYQNRAYWNREIAGLLFNEMRFSLSAKLYANCLKQGPYSHEPITKALTADAHFMSRNFEESIKLFEEYHEVEENPELEFTLKKQVIKTIKDEYGLRDSYSQSKAIKLFDQLKNDDLHESNEQLVKCLEYDPICSEVRFQEGLNLMEAERFEEACLSFLISALVSENNVSAWLNSFFMAVETQSHMMGCRGSRVFPTRGQ